MMKTEQSELTLLQQVKPGDWLVRDGLDGITGATQVERLTAKQIICGKHEDIRLDDRGKRIGGKGYWRLGTEQEVQAYCNRVTAERVARLRQEQELKTQQATPEYKAASLIHGHIEHVLGTDGLSKIGLDRLNKIRDALDI